MTRLSKWAATMAVAWQVQAAYRLNFVLLVLGPALVFFFVRLSLWSSLFALRDGAAIGGIGRDAMIAYQCWVLVVTLASQGYQSTDLAQDIRLGRISAHLLHPFSFLEFHAAHWLAFQCLQLVVVGVLLGLAVAAGVVPAPAPAALATGLAYCWLVSALWFTMNGGIGLLAFWLEETWVLRVLLKDLAIFFSGASIPLELFPAGLREALFWTPFPYLTWVPARILAGEPVDAGQAALVTLAWTAAGVLACVLVWRRGLAEYSAAGM